MLLIYYDNLNSIYHVNCSILTLGRRVDRSCTR